MTTADGPVITPEMLIIAAMLGVVREHKGFEWCKKRGVGAIRRRLGPALPSNAVALAEFKYAGLGEIAGAERDAQTFLNSVCQSCRGCELGKV